MRIVRPFPTALTILLVVAALFVTGCGSSTPAQPVPDLVGERLDVAKSAAEDAGYDTEELGGGTFGIVVESNWTVCETDPPAGQIGSGTIRLIVDRSCPDTASAATGATEQEQNAAEQESAEQAEAEPEPTAARKRKPKKKRQPRRSSSARTRIIVPGVIGMDHQAAQNRMQAAGLYNLRELDGTGQGRLLIWDRNWVVIDQRPAPGSTATENTKVTLISVKDDEL